MSQTTDTTLADQSGASFRSELNNIISALNTDFSGSVAPTTPEAYMVWRDTSATPNVLRSRNSANSAWEVYPVVEGVTNASSAKTTPVDADLLPLVDSAASFGLKKLSWLNVKVALKTYFDTLYLSLSGGTLTGLLKFANGAGIASSSTVNLSTATGNTVKITGTTTINAWTMTSGQVMDVIFTSVLTLTHNATTNNLNNGGSNITTAANDRARIYYDGTTVWFLCYTRASGAAISSPTLPITKEYASSQQTITSAGLLTLAHGLGAVPKIVTAELVCQTADLGYTAGKVVQTFLGTTGTYGVSVETSDSVNLVVRFSNNGNVFSLPNATTGANAGITTANWKIVFRAYA